jgi:hypothetical protein
MKYLNLFLVATQVSAIAGADDPNHEQDIDGLDFLPFTEDLVGTNVERARKLKVFPAVPPTHNSDLPEGNEVASEVNEIPPIEEDFANEIPPIEEGPEESYEVPSESYEAPPATETPATTTDAPAEEYEVPSVEDVPDIPGESYEVPSAPAESYEVPAASLAPTPPAELPEVPALPVDVVLVPVESNEIPPHSSVAAPAVCTPVCWDECRVLEKVLWSERPTSVCTPSLSREWRRAAEANPTFGNAKRPCFATGGEAGRWRRGAHFGDKKSKVALCEQRAAVPIVCRTELIREQKIVPVKICENTCRQSC